MPPYHQNKSMAEQRFLFSLADRGGISEDDALGRARASKGKKLPEHVSKRRSKRSSRRG